MIFLDTELLSATFRIQKSFDDDEFNPSLKAGYIYYRCDNISGIFNLFFTRFTAF